MDEIVHRYPQPKERVSAQEPVSKKSARSEGWKDGLRQRVLKAVAAVQTGVRTLSRETVRRLHRADCALAGQKLISPAPFLALSAVVASVLVLGTV
jgi:hypothetical protein